jgi:magnesium and cobalt transporter
VIAAAHSRFPVFEGSRANVIGTLLAKDLLRHSSEKDFQVRDWLRPAVFIPESKRLSVLLRDFKDNRNHLAIVVDEYGDVAGIITIEDVLEQIVGDIEDEHDIDDEADNLITLDNGDIRVKGITEIAQLNASLGTHFDLEDIETVAGLVIQHLGRVPKIGEITEIDGIQFEVLRADPRQIHLQRLRSQRQRAEVARPEESNPVIPAPKTWPQPDGAPVSCREKLKTLAENHAELAQIMQDAFEDAVLMGVDEAAMRAILTEMVGGLSSPKTRAA